jgi:hypothetical protein
MVQLVKNGLLVTDLAKSMIHAWAMDVQQGEFETMIFIKNTNWQQEIRRHQLR